MSFGEDLRLFREKVEGRLQEVFVGSVAAVHGSITDGSEITAAPGQPVDTGNLLASWQQTFPEDLVGEVSTAVAYAESIEDGFSYRWGVPMTLRSEVGGFHSVKTTRASWDRIVESETLKAKGG